MRLTPTRFCASGLDLSSDMLQVAHAKHVYRQLLEADLNCLDSTVHLDASYDVGVCVGVFTPNHCGVPALTELLRVVKRGGLVFMTLRDDFWRDSVNAFQQHIADLMAAEKLTLVSKKRYLIFDFD